MKTVYYPAIVDKDDNVIEIFEDIDDAKSVLKSDYCYMGYKVKMIECEDFESQYEFEQSSLGHGGY